MIIVDTDMGDWAGPDLVDRMSGKRMQVPEFCTAAGTAASAATKSRRKLLSRRPGAPLVTVVEKSGYQQGSLDE